MRITSLHVYPVKGMRGTSVTRLELGPRGPRYDRHWMVVDAQGRFLTQRTLPLMARLVPSVGDHSLTIDAPGSKTLVVPLQADSGRRAVTIWRDTFEAVDCGDEAARWLTAFIGQPCRLVRMADEVRRTLDPTYSPRADAHTGFADAYPVLLTNEASLRELNSRLSVSVPMNRFRANVVVDATAPWAEEHWQLLRVAKVELDAVKPCARCVVTTTDQLTGARLGTEPLATLGGYRVLPHLGAIFGMNLVPRSEGVLQVGELVSVLR